VRLTAYVVDTVAIEQLRDTLQTCAQLCADQGVLFHLELRTQDFIPKTEVIPTPHRQR
jgi:hypothetical protein